MILISTMLNITRYKISLVEMNSRQLEKREQNLEEKKAENIKMLVLSTKQRYLKLRNRI